MWSTTRMNHDIDTQNPLSRPACQAVSSRRAELTGRGGAVVRIFRVMALAAFATVAVAVAGCASQTINMCADASAMPPDALATASSKAIAAAATEAEPVVRARTDWPPITVAPESGAVTHWPIWWENHVAERGSHDGRTATTWEDLAAAFYCPLRFAANTGALPLSMVVNPPGSIMVSDGRPGKRPLWQRLDAAAATGPGPDTFVPVAARPSQPPSAEPVVLPAQPIPATSNSDRTNTDRH